MPPSRSRPEPENRSDRPGETVRAREAAPRLLSPRDLAGALGVSESSLKRWVDAGRIHATRTEGGHRRIALPDALAFIRETGAPVLRPELLDGVEPAALGSLAALATLGGGAPALDDVGLYHALLEGDQRAVRAWFGVHQQTTRLADLCDGPIREAMYKLGELWQHDPDGVFIEHRATDLCVQALAQLRSAVEPPPGAPVALGGAPEDDPYVLPSAMAALVLAAEGFRAINLGADTPTAALHRAIAHHRPALVWISASAPLPVAQAHELAAFATSLPPDITVIVGGRQRKAIAEADPRVRTAGSMAELAALASDHKLQES